MDKKILEVVQYNLVYIREYLGVTAEEFANMIGITRQTMSNLENNKTKLSKVQYLAILYVLGDKDPLIKEFMTKKVKTVKRHIDYTFKD